MRSEPYFFIDPFIRSDSLKDCKRICIQNAKKFSRIFFSTFRPIFHQSQSFYFCDKLKGNSFGRL